MALTSIEDKSVGGIKGELPDVSLLLSQVSSGVLSVVMLTNQPGQLHPWGRGYLRKAHYGDITTRTAQVYLHGSFKDVGKAFQH